MNFSTYNHPPTILSVSVLSQRASRIRRSRILRILLPVGLLLCPIADAGEEEFISPFGAAIDNIIEIGLEKGWPRVALSLRKNALHAYQESEAYTEEWYYLYRWTRLFARSERALTQEWVEATEKAGLAHGNLAERYPLDDRPLGDGISEDLMRFLLRKVEFSGDYFDLVTPYDYRIRVFSTLDSLFHRFPTYFEKYRNLALAIAIVYDVPPPPGWPHFQVPSTVLWRRLNPIGEVFDYWVRLSESRQSAFDLSLLSAEQLKFLVDTPAPIEELHWARSTITTAIDDFASVYASVPYRHDRISYNQYIWNESDYSLKSILQRGGICVDQAYYASQVGKARGIPTLLFRGAGMDGRHAWFGFLENKENWEFDAERLGDNVYITGYAHDPQTWTDVTDHELTFLGERFRESHYYRQSIFHSNFAQLYLALNNPEAALEAAEKALDYERRNRNAWEAKLKATKQITQDPVEGEGVLRMAARAFRNYPDLETFYLDRVNDSLVARGELSRARREKDILAVKNRSERSDLSISQAAGMLRQSIDNDELQVQLRNYRVILIKMEGSGKMDLFDRVVKPFVAYLLVSGYPREARRMAILAQQRLDAPPSSMLAQALEGLVRRTEE